VAIATSLTSLQWSAELKRYTTDSTINGATPMFTFQVRLSPKPGNPGGNITVTVQASSDTEARTIAASQNPTYQVQACHKQ